MGTEKAAKAAAEAALVAATAAAAAVMVGRRSFFRYDAPCRGRRTGKQAIKQDIYFIPIHRGGRGGKRQQKQRQQKQRQTRQMSKNEAAERPCLLRCLAKAEAAEAEAEARFPNRFFLFRAGERAERRSGAVVRAKEPTH